LIIPRGICTVPNPLWAAGHFHGQGKRLTAAPLARYELDDVGNDPTQYGGGISIDQLIAQEMNPGGRGALNLRVGQMKDSAQGAISYRGSDDPVFAQGNPAVAYGEIIGLAGASEEARARIISRRQSVLDLVRGEMEELERMSLSRADRDKLDLHFTTIRELESDLVSSGLMYRLSAGDEARLDDVNPGNIRASQSVPELADLQIRVLALAIATGYTHSATLEIGPSAGNIVYDFDGLTLEYGHHKISHGSTTDGSDGPDLPGWEDMMHGIDRWHANRFLQLIEALDAYEEEGGTVLDNSVVVWSNELSRGRSHNTRDVPFIMAGSCGGYLRTGQYTKLTADSDELLDASTRNNRPIYSTVEQYRAGEIHYRSTVRGITNDAPHNKLLTTILNAVGVRDEGGGPVEMFGRGTGTLAGEFDELKAG
jgi:hypothetical protein